VSDPPDGSDSPDRVAALVEQWELREALGGVRGVVDSSLASLVFLMVYVADRRQLVPALWCALGATVMLLGLRLVRREPLRQAAGGVLVVAVSAALAVVTGRAANYYLLGILVQVLYGVAYLVSLVVRWPLLGVLLGPLLGEGFRWRSVPARRRAYWWASLVWFGIFAMRVAIQVPLYVNDQVVSLGVAKLLLGWPLFAVGLLASWLILRRVPPALAPDSDASDEVSPRPGEG